MKPEILQKLIDMAGQNRDLAATRRSRAEQARAKASGTLDALEQYRQSHRSNRESALGVLPGAAGLSVHARFGGKLDEAIDAQRDQCTGLERSVGDRAEELRRAQARLQALRALELRRARAKQRRADSAEQRMLDEFAATRHANARVDR